MRLAVLAATVGLVVLTPMDVVGDDPVNFDFLGYAIIPTTIGGTLTLRSVINNINPTPIALDFDTKQHTLVVTGTLSVVGPPQEYTPATIEIYSDPISTGTAADYAAPGTFTNGDLILSGTFDGILKRNVFSPTLGNFIGAVDFTGGTRLGELSDPQDWPFFGGWSNVISVIPDGYDEEWDGKIDEPQSLAVEQEEWGAIKRLFR